MSPGKYWHCASLCVNEFKMSRESLDDAKEEEQN